MHRFSASTILLLMLLTTLAGCSITRSNAPEPAQVIQKAANEHEFAVSDISISFANALGFSIRKNGSDYVVESSGEFTPAYLSGIRNGDILDAVNEFPLQNLDKKASASIIESLFKGNVTIKVRDKNGSARDMQVEYNRRNCPQKKSRSIVYVSSPVKGEFPNLCFFEIISEIEPVTFEHHAVNWLRYLNPGDKAWFVFEPDFHVFDPGTNLSNMKETLSNGFDFSIDQESSENTISFNGEKTVSLIFPAWGNDAETQDKILEKGTLNVGNVLSSGSVFLKHEDMYYTLPFHEETTLESYPLADSSRYEEELVDDYIILVDGRNNGIEIDFNGKINRWYGIFYPADTHRQEASSTDSNIIGSKASIQFTKCDVSWFDEVVDGFETYPYPTEMKIEISKDDTQINLQLVISFPNHLDDGRRLYAAVRGQEILGDGTEIPVAGLLERHFFQQPANI
jgi:hypothetical protein